MISTKTRNQSTAPWTADPERWPDVAAAAGSPARAAVAQAVFGTAVARLPVRVRLPDGSPHGGGDADAPVMHIRQPREFFRRFGASGLIGFGESYMAGEWDSPDHAGSRRAGVPAPEAGPPPCRTRRGPRPRGRANSPPRPRRATAPGRRSTVRSTGFWSWC